MHVRNTRDHGGRRRLEALLELVDGVRELFDPLRRLEELLSKLLNLLGGRSARWRRGRRCG
jgi:hypothetical protein